MIMNEMVDIINKNKQINIAGMTNMSKSYLISGLFSYLKNNNIFIVTYNELQARMLYKDFKQLLGEDALYFPAREIILYDIIAKSSDITQKRLKVIKQLISQKNPKVIVTTFESLMQKMVPIDLIKKSMFDLKVGEIFEQETFIQRLSNNGYVRSNIVDGMGQFSVRGGIVDFCQFEGDMGYRVEFFGDEIDSIRLFDVDTQRTAKMLKEVNIFPCTEWIIDKTQIDIVKQEIEKEYMNVNKKLIDEINYIFEIKNFKNIDKYFDYFYKDYSTIQNFVGENCITIVDEKIRTYESGSVIYKDFIDSYTNLLEKKQILKKSVEILLQPESIINEIESKKTLYFSMLETKKVDILIKSRDIEEFENINDLINSIKDYNNNGYKTLIYAGNKNSCKHLCDELKSFDISCEYKDKFDVSSDFRNYILEGLLSGSFELTQDKVAIITSKKLFGEKKKVTKPPKKSKIDFNDFIIGDFVVHRYHGIGKYIGTNVLKVDGVVREYLQIEYKDNAMLYVPTSQLDLVDRYIGSEGKQPKLSKMGGVEWKKAKAKVKESLRDIANELIEVYAKRQSTKGYAFSKDTVWQKDFEDRFEYIETDDQLKCIEEVKSDMQSLKVMDRLLCGDVGFGKTEIALRAAFKAVMDGKQVAYLVPTTVLANQHYNTFLNRMRGFPIKVEMLSRFKTLANKNKIIKDLKAGIVDVVVGTHSIIQKNVGFKDLGLLIIDEEQKFGVSHKEKLKQLYPNVDVLTLTATPIPRTLHMSMVNIRDISVIYEAPQNRHPIQTKVLEYDEDIIREAIVKEIARGGQVFYVYNRVISLESVATKISKLVPEARIIVGHGKMSSTYLESVMTKFINGEADILLCTTIIESGVDIPNANTMIVEDADKLGLAQLYQLKGRIGRSSRVANAYLMYKRDKILSEIAEKRLKAISDFTEFGSGFKIAMRDLQIRGAGNLLGAEQHGHMESVGYDTYCRLLDEAVKESQGEDIKEFLDIQIDIGVSAYIGEDYIKDEGQRIEFYKKIATCQTNEDISYVKDEIIDRYGDISKSIENLFKIAEIKILARKCGIVSIKEMDNSIRFDVEPIILNVDYIGILSKLYRGKILFNAGKVPFIIYKTKEVKEKLLLDIVSLLESYCKVIDENIIK